MVKKFPFFESQFNLCLHFGLKYFEFFSFFVIKFLLPFFHDLFDFLFGDHGKVFDSVVMKAVEVPGAFASHEFLVGFGVLARGIDFMIALGVVVHFGGVEREFGKFLSLEMSSCGVS